MAIKLGLERRWAGRAGAVERAKEKLRARKPKVADVRASGPRCAPCRVAGAEIQPGCCDCAAHRDVERLERDTDQLCGEVARLTKTGNELRVEVERVQDDARRTLAHEQRLWSETAAEQREEMLVVCADRDDARAEVARGGRAIRDAVAEDRDAVRALVATLPVCSVCDSPKAPATKSTETWGDEYICDAHASPDVYDLSYAPALRALLARIEAWDATANSQTEERRGQARRDG
jgi:hypothetical protein